MNNMNLYTHMNNNMNINIHIDINMNIDIHIIINMNRQYWYPQAPLRRPAALFYHFSRHAPFQKGCFCHFASVFSSYLSILVNFDQYTVLRTVGSGP